MAGTNACKPGLSPDRRMEQAAVKQELERGSRRRQSRLATPNNRRPDPSTRAFGPRSGSALSGRGRGPQPSRGERNGGERGNAAAKPAGRPEHRRRTVRAYRTQSLDVASTHFKEIGGGEFAKELPTRSERGFRVRALRNEGPAAGERFVPEPLSALPVVETSGRGARRPRGRLRRHDGAGRRPAGRATIVDDRAQVHALRRRSPQQGRPGRSRPVGPI